MDKSMFYLLTYLRLRTIVANSFANWRVKTFFVYSSVVSRQRLLWGRSFIKGAL